MTQRIFISYRRQDSRGDAGRIYDRLLPEFGESGLFMDVARIPLGVNFVHVLREEVAKCHVLLAVIGPGWLEAKDDDGSRRLDNPNDFVRVEIAAALARDILVVPILLEGTKMPKASALPADIQELSQRNALDVRHSSFHADLDKLTSELKRHHKTAAPTLAPNYRTSIITTIPTPTALKFAPKPNDLVIMEEVTLPNLLFVHPDTRPNPLFADPTVKPASKQLSWHTNRQYLNAVPAAEEVIALRGSWLPSFTDAFDTTRGPDQYSGLFTGMPEPSCFAEYFMVCHMNLGIPLAPGCILTGANWMSAVDGSFALWEIKHGYATAGGVLTSAPWGYLSHLGPTWNSEYSQLSADVFKQLGGKPLSRFVTHP